MRFLNVRGKGVRWTLAGAAVPCPTPQPVYERFDVVMRDLRTCLLTASLCVAASE